VRVFSRLMLPLVAAALLLSPLRPAAAVEKPVAVVALSSPGELSSDGLYLMELMGQKDQADMIRKQLDAFKQFIDMTRPMGAVAGVKMAEGGPPQPQVLAFLPITDLKPVLAIMKQNLGQEPPMVDGAYQMQVNPAVSVLFKKVGDWVYLTTDKALFDTAPADPIGMLGGLERDYDVAVQIRLQNIPPMLRSMMMEQMKKAVEEASEGPGTGDPAEEAGRALAKLRMKQMVQVLNDLDSVTMGWSVDGMARSTYIDISVTAVPGSTTAEQIKYQLQGDGTAFAGFVNPDAAMTLHSTSKIPPEDAEVAKKLLSTVKTEAIKEIENDPDLPNKEAKDAAKEVITLFLDGADKILDDGRADMAATLKLAEKKMTFVAGAYLADGKQFEKGVKKLVELAKGEPDFPKVTLDAEEYKGITLHTLNAPIPEGEDEARAIFGESLDVVLGFSADSGYLAVGSEAMTALKNAIDLSASAGKKDLGPFEMSVGLKEFFQFAKSVSPDPQVSKMAEAFDASNDRIAIKASAVENGARYRIAVGEGVLGAVGKLAPQLGGEAEAPAPGGGFDDF